LRNCDCGPSNFDFRNSATIRSLLPILQLSGTFSSAQDGFKNQPKIFLELSVSLEIQKLALKGHLHEIFTSDFFLWTPARFYGQKYAENCGNGSSQVADLKLRTSEKIAIAELRSCSCGATFL
jgi:hypothetical protein